MTPNEAIAPYRAQSPAKPMKAAALNADELCQMQRSDGMNEFPSPPAPNETFPRHTSLPNSRDSAPEARHLWVIRSDDLPVALEACAWGSTLESRKIKHSNLTGGASAHSGGEVWFIGEDRIAISACSGRYGAENEGEFNLIVEAFRRAGYHVASTGFDIDNDTKRPVANRTLVGDPIWQPPL